jgi:PAS domain S-box-containing protein
VPSLLNLLGYDFAFEVTDQVVDPNLTESGTIYNFRGLLTYTILVWTAICMAFFSFVLSFFHYYLKRDVVSPVIGISLVWGGFMDVFHTLAADRLIQASAENEKLIPLTWAVGRTFSIVILLIGVMVLMIRRYRGIERGNMRLLIMLSLAFGLAAYALIYYLANSEKLPIVVFPDAIISRPWDVYPLLIYVIAGTYVFRKFHQQRRDHFSFSIWISILPDFVTQLHMAFGSTELFDNHFNLAHFFKVTSYAVPAMGLMMDFFKTNQQLEIEVKRHEGTEKRRRQLVALVSQSSESIAVVDIQGRFRYLNPSGQSLLGFKGAALEGLELETFFADETNSYFKEKIYNTLMAGEFFNAEISIQPLNRKAKIPLHCSAFLLPVADENEQMVGLIFRDITLEVEYRAEQARHSVELETLVTQRTAELNQANQTLMNQLRERKTLERQLVQAQKMESVGQLVAGIAHEINNPMSYVMMNFETLGKYVESYRSIMLKYQELEQQVLKEATQRPVLSELKKIKVDLQLDYIQEDFPLLLKESSDGLYRVRDIVQNLKQFSKPQDDVLNEVDLNLGLKSSLKVVWNEAKRCEIIEEYGEIPLVYGARTDINQVFLNLLLNAIHAMDGYGKLSIKTEKDSDWIRVRIKDSGPGIPESLYSRIFDPFFTTKEAGKGTGLGLYISYGIMEKHRGKLRFESTLGQGTEFILEFPINSVVATN